MAVLLLVMLLLLLLCGIQWLGLGRVAWALLSEASGSESLQATASALNDVLSAHCTGGKIASFTPDEVLPWASSMRAAHPEIYRELLTYETREEGAMSPPFGALDPAQLTLTRGECWRTLWLVVYGRRAAATEHFPRTMELLSATSVTTAMFSILEPGCSIGRHSGENKAVLRYHLGIEVPPTTDETLELRIDHPERRLKFSWANGSDLLFDDTFSHEVVNTRAAGRRVVLFVDVPREDCGALNALLPLLIQLIGRTERVGHLWRQVNLWPERVRALSRMSARLSEYGVGREYLAM